MHEAGEIELKRIWTKIDSIRRKQASKPKPICSPATTTLDPVLVLVPDAQKAPSTRPWKDGFPHYPWYRVGSKVFCVTTPVADTGLPEAKYGEIDIENADFICLSSNHHEDLVTALESVKPHLELYCRENKGAGGLALAQLRGVLSRVAIAKKKAEEIKTEEALKNWPTIDSVRVEVGQIWINQHNTSYAHVDNVYPDHASFILKDHDGKDMGTMKLNTRHTQRFFSGGRLTNPPEEKS